MKNPFWELKSYAKRLKTDFGSPKIAAKYLIENSFVPIPRNGFVYGFAGFGNAGDHASMQGVRIFCGKTGPAWILNKISNRDLEFLKKRNAVLVVGGGGLFQPVFESTWRRILESGQVFGIVGVGLAEAPPNRPRFCRGLLAEILQRSFFTIVRDSYTATTIRSCGGACEMAFCPSLLAIRAATKLSSSRQNLLHVIHPSDLRFAGFDVENVKQRAREVAQNQRLTYSESNHECPFSNSLLLKYDQSKICLSSRLHGCLFSLCRGIPSVPLVCDQKTAELYKTHTDFKVDTRHFLWESELSIDLACPPFTQRKLDELSSHLCDLRIPFWEACYRCLSKVNGVPI